MCRDWIDLVLSWQVDIDCIFICKIAHFATRCNDDSIGIAIYYQHDNGSGKMGVCIVQSKGSGGNRDHAGVK